MSKTGFKKVNIRAVFILFSFIIITSMTFLSAGRLDGEVLRENKHLASFPPLREEESIRGTVEGTKEGEKEEETPEEKELRIKEERERLEERRREKYRDFYVPLPHPDEEKASPVKARGLYLTGHTVGHPRYQDLLEMVEETELNALVIDVKDDHGLMSYSSDISKVQEIGADETVPVSDMRKVLEELQDKGIFPIARVVVFKDPYLAEQKPSWAIQRKEGGIWRDRKGVGWTDPYNKKVWDYNIAVAREAALMGFREIQFDYVRFPENASRMDKEAQFPSQSEVPRDKLIQEFLLYAAEKLEDYNVYLSADVFGVITTSWGDSDRIGQTWEKLSSSVDYICPMVYPSHYGPGYFGFDVPDSYPRETVKHALRDAIERNAPLKDPAILRPWLQSFTASWIRGNISYGPQEVRAQIDVALELGIDEFLLWNARNRYNSDALLGEEESSERREKMIQSRKDAGKDALGRTPSEAVEKFLVALKEGDWRKALPIHRSEDLHYKNYSSWMKTLTLKPEQFKIAPPAASANKEKWFEEGVTLALEVELSGEEHHFELQEESWEVSMENHIWRVEPSAEFLKLLKYEKKEENAVNSQDFRRNS